MKQEVSFWQLSQAREAIRSYIRNTEFIKGSISNQSITGQALSSRAFPSNPNGPASIHNALWILALQRSVFHFWQPEDCCLSILAMPTFGSAQLRAIIEPGHCSQYKVLVSNQAHETGVRGVFVSSLFQKSQRLLFSIGKTQTVLSTLPLPGQIA